MRQLFNPGRMQVSFAIAILSMVCASSLHGRQLSLSEANALCAAGVETQFGQSMKPKDYAKDAYLQQQRQNNQSKVGVGMNREDVLQLVGPPDFAGGRGDLQDG